MNISYVYKWTHLPTLMWYVGSHTSKTEQIEESYICSSKYVKPLVIANPSEWKREIIATDSSPTGVTSMLSLEEEILMTFDAKNDNRSFNRNNHVLRKDGSNVTGKKRVHLNDIQLFVTVDELPLFLEQGWKQGWSEKSIQKFKAAAPDYSGSKNPMYGTKRVAPNKGVPMLEEHKKKLRVPKSKKVRECCGIECCDANYVRWHGENCKTKKLGASELNEQQHKGEF